MSEEVKALGEGVLTSPQAALLPAGVYWFGDPAYVVGEHHEIWQQWVELSAASSQNFLNPLGGALIFDLPLVAANTLYGDGVYTSSSGRTYGVDSGCLGLVPEELIKKLDPPAFTLENLGTWHTLPDVVQFTASEEGLIAFGEERIWTGEPGEQPEKSA